MIKKIVLRSFPNETFPENLTFFQQIVEQMPKVPAKYVLIQVYYISIDPVARVWVSGAKTYLPAIKIGGAIPGFGIGVIVESRSSMFDVGMWVTGVMQWSTHICRKASQVLPLPIKIQKTYRFLSIFGPTGLTAYVALVEEISQYPKSTSIVISSAAGATGIAFCQYARSLGYTNIVGIAGSDEKCKFVTDQLGCRNCINYKKQGTQWLYEDIGTELRKIFPKGVQIYFDNVGEEILEALIPCMKNHSKIILCGATATYARWKSKQGISNYLQIITRSITLKGILYFGQMDKLITSLPEMMQLAEHNSIEGYETIVDGIQRAPEALKAVYNGEFTGKAIIRVQVEPISKL